VAKRPKQYEDEPETISVTIGSYDGFTEVPKGDKRVKRQIGFIRPKVKQRGKKNK
jgi:hypothetical protein